MSILCDVKLIHSCIILKPMATREQNPTIVLFRQEGITVNSLPLAGIRKGEPLINASIYLFGFILNDRDERWSIIQSDLETKAKESFRPRHFENALLAVYLSKRGRSFRNKYSRWTSEPNLRHLCRAIQNLAANISINHAFTESSLALPEDVSLQLTKTDKITEGINYLGVTGCPESLYQIRLFNHGQYAARIGFNLHQEGDGQVLSISNLQGAKNGLELINTTAQRLDLSPFNFLVQRLKTLAGALERPTEIIGIKNPINSPALYNSVFRAEKVQRLSFHR